VCGETPIAADRGDWVPIGGRPTADPVDPVDSLAGSAPSSGSGRDPARTQLLHIPSLDGLRGLAVATVLLFHSQFHFARGGYLGVSAFFTLSGFLITTLVLVAHDASGRVDLPGFWGRRARRLLPAAFVALGEIMVFGVFVADQSQRSHLRGDVLSALLYVANWRFIFAHQSYADLFNGSPSPVLHFWSLAIEEQFYLLFPLLAALLLWWGRGRTRLFGAVLAMLTVASVVVSNVLISANGNTTRVYYGTDTRAAELLIGALLAVAIVGRRRPAGLARGALGVAGWIALAAILVMWSMTAQTSSWLYHGGFALHAVLVAVVLAEIALAGSLSTALSVKPLRALGVISYGVYLYHWPIYLWLTPNRLPGLPAVGLFALRVAVTLAVAIASFYFIERPVRNGVRIKVLWPRVVAPATAFALLVATFVVVRPESVPASDRITYAPISKLPPLSGGTVTTPRDANIANVPPFHFTAPPARSDTQGDPTTLLHRPYDGSRPLRVLVVGDSVGLTLGRGIELWGIGTRRAQVWNDAHLYCAVGRNAPILEFGGTATPARVCNDWGQRWPAEIRSFDPDVTIVLYTVWETIQRKPPGAQGWELPGNPQYDSWQLSEYERAVDVLSARGGTVVWLTAPCVSITGPLAQTVRTSMNQAFDYLNDHQFAALAKARPKTVRLVDLHAELCPDGKFHESYGSVANAEPDGAHFSDPGAEAVANWLMNRILAD
jgi:peptidoglycan/LPS O-acetylase OafA/YrhL